MSDTLALASRLQHESNEALAALLTARQLAKRDLRDFFDLADALLQPDSIQDALSHLDRPTLAALAAAASGAVDGPEFDGARAAMLVYDVDRADGTDTIGTDTDTATNRVDANRVDANRVDTNSENLSSSVGTVKPYDAVTAVLASWPSRGLPSAEQLAAEPPPVTVKPPTAEQQQRIDLLAGERAFETTIAVTELAIALASAPARELAKGGLAVPDSKRLAAATGLEPDDMNTIIQIAQNAGLVVRDGSIWYESSDAHEWLLQSLAERWGSLASAWLASIAEPVASVLRARVASEWGTALGDYFEWLYPAGGEAQRVGVAAIVREADRLAITALGRASSAGLALLADDGTQSELTAVSLIAAQLPAEVSTVYVQHDLTIVAPGPLRPDIDATLRQLAQIESHSIASSYRISAGSIARALSAGYTAASIRNFLGEISSTGIPQPLEYLIAESSARYGLLRAGEVPAAAGEFASSYVRSDDRELLHTIAADHNFGSLGLVFVNENRLVSRFGLETVYWMLVDARYPVIAETPSGHPQSLTRVKPAEPQKPSASGSVDELINRLRGSGVQGGANTAEAWLVRQLDAAVKNKTPVLVTVRLPNGSDVTFPMVPTSIASGRMRGTDQKAGVERTLPLSSITTVAAVSPVA